MGPRGAAYTQCRSNSLGADFAMISNAELDRLIAELGTRPVPGRRATISWCAATVWPASSENTLLPPDTEKPCRIDPVENGAERHVPARHPGRHALPMGNDRHRWPPPRPYLHTSRRRFRLHL